ncbi:hypothetical protein H4R99_005125 [Coemansia sp. RSA 1722]|nr:hypothetical protein LPJ57_004957 [Coemansia sp. RSA 486]KAJ2595947.1 hypothetical protein H4R99_005125 [Coemansia sp. RSA 1722]KAJ2596787.1 hypothetical protein GGF39_003303 [Coemansia sp. RSA 1721]
MLRSKIKRAATKAVKAVKNILRKAKTLVSSQRLAVEPVCFVKCDQVKQNVISDTASTSIAPDYMDTANLEEFINTNLLSRCKHPVGEYNNFHILRDSAAYKGCARETNNHSDNSFDAAEMPGSPDAILKHKQNTTTDIYGSIDTNAAAMKTRLQSNVAINPNYSGEYGFAAGSGSVTESGTNLSSGPTFTGECGLKEPQDQDQKLIWFIGICKQFQFVFKQMNADVDRARTAAIVVRANIRHIISEAADCCASILISLRIGIDTDNRAETATVGYF